MSSSSASPSAQLICENVCFICILVFCDFDVIRRKVSSRGIKTLDFAGTKEVVYERSDWPLPKLQEYLKDDTLALIGYGSQGHGQGLNARDNGLNVIVGVRKDGESWRQAMEDGWVRAGLFFPTEKRFSATADRIHNIIHIFVTQNRKYS